jgi:hypothetical protein
LYAGAGGKSAAPAEPIAAKAKNAAVAREILFMIAPNGWIAGNHFTPSDRQIPWLYNNTGEK